MLNEILFIKGIKKCFNNIVKYTYRVTLITIFEQKTIFQFKKLSVQTCDRLKIEYFLEQF